ncbi:MAG: PASTA domain-containing protein [Erysipelotrichaceae bacterium]|nr:PASTA domain-containing protein [Erysipelotrichaceae bacterium]
MPDNKDFLDQFSNEGKPASFEEEERVPVQKEKKPLNVKAIVIAAAVLLLIGIASYFLFLAPKIVMPDFEGKTRNDVGAWVKQQGIDSSGIIFDSIYDFDNEEGMIISQSIKAGKKVRKNVKLNFTESKGPDPDEEIAIPDLDSMSKEDIQEWIASNKLLKTKISTSYNENVEENTVIDYSFTGCEADSFTRGCNLKINISKGAAPAGTVTVEDFEKKPFATVEAWAKSKKIELNVVEQYSDKIEKDNVISQSISSGKTMKEGETLTVVVSRGKAVYMEQMIGWDKEKVTSWCAKNSLAFKLKEIYSDQPEGVCISQSIPKGKLLSDDDYLEATVSLGNYVKIGDYYNRPYHTVNGVEGLHEFKDAQNDKGADISTSKSHEFDDVVPAGYVISNDREVEVGGTLHVVISKGKNILLEDLPITDADGNVTETLRWSDLASGASGMNEEKARKLCGEDVNFIIDYVNNGGTNGQVVYAVRSDGGALAAGVYLPQDVTVTIIINDNSR